MDRLARQVVQRLEALLRIEHLGHDDFPGSGEITRAGQSMRNLVVELVPHVSGAVLIACKAASGGLLLMV